MTGEASAADGGGFAQPSYMQDGAGYMLGIHIFPALFFWRG